MKGIRRTVGRFLSRVGRRVAGVAFKGAEGGRLFLDWIWAPLVAADQEMRAEMRSLRANARELARNNPYVRQYLALLVANVIGPKGVRLQGQVRRNDGTLATTINDKIERHWYRWGRSVTVDGRQSLQRLSTALLKAVAVDGEAFVRKVYGYPHNSYRFALQPLDADLLDHEYNMPAGDGKNEIRLGVEVDSWLRPVAYHFWDRHPDDLNTTLPRKRERIPADEIYHLYDPDRVNQTRGVTWFKAVMRSLKMLAGYVEAELVAARTASAKMGWLSYKDASAFDPPEPGAVQTMDAEPGTVETLPPGMEFVPWSPEHPSTAFPPFVKQILRETACGLRVSYNALANDLEGVNYSSMRSGLLIERDWWRVLQRWWIECFLDRVYRDWLSTALLAGELVLDTRDPRRFEEVKWQPRGWAWVDPLKDVQAAILAISAGLGSRTGALAEQGDDFEDVIADLQEESALAAEAGLSFELSTRRRSGGEEPQDDEDPDDAAAAGGATTSDRVLLNLAHKEKAYGRDR